MVFIGDDEVGLPRGDLGPEERPAGALLDRRRCQSDRQDEISEGRHGEGAPVETAADVDRRRQDQERQVRGGRPVASDRTEKQDDQEEEQDRRPEGAQEPLSPVDRPPAQEGGDSQHPGDDGDERRD